MTAVKALGVCTYSQTCARPAEPGYKGCERCREQGNRSSRARYRRDPDAYNHARACANRGITVEQYAEMLDAQDGACAICKGSANYHRRLCIDHDHACCPEGNNCGKCVRGLLCNNCNRALGLLKESTEVLQSALAYLDSFGPEG